MKKRSCKNPQYHSSSYSFLTCPSCGQTIARSYQPELNNPNFNQVFNLFESQTTSPEPVPEPPPPPTPSFEGFGDGGGASGGGGSSEW